MNIITIAMDSFREWVLEELQNRNASVRRRI